ncbi:MULTISPECIES: hypothetical protein [unclassified Tolypothrix]|uniref:hypothetical protein n=1 Tax=unclassified Tolypothrix TaxID=2649714 RepID=UPI0005EAA505|nr:MULTISPECIES: hypothetical protein [unclassified Tolypothrix]BAY90980.1 hypothetical protein NIES3275_30000 [Microchaete diplosiphon NIES-3275]EKE99771.1 hypothetical protein FDUTEX481_09648 [Tolypothrix sp. PCC 7601]MBE9082500.1 hypothetical protein [Tolypothrix sp. LEGE 11397]UYD25087.1 hypothetical protein HGR01_27380 [Tolypothrix sp. PCC 7712]UYD32675.1 hypothetical protein HG267_27240 [Tolypothrix sp. PCC 7601]
MNSPALLYPSISTPAETAVKKIVDKIISSGTMSRQDHTLLTSTILANGDISEGERRLINRVFDHIQTGQLKLLDW